MKFKRSTKIRVTRTGRRLVLFLAVCLSCLLTSCNVTRTVTTSASSFQNGDTTTTIITKTVESYDATKKNR